MSAWSATALYRRGAITTHAGVTWRAAADNYNAEPPANPWVVAEGVDAAALVDDLSGVSDAGTARTNLGLGTAAVEDSSAFDAAGDAAAAVGAHTGDTSDAHDASAISVDSTSLSGIATDVQGSLGELDDAIDNHVGDTSAAHAASAISFTPYSTLASTDVQAAIQELLDESGGSYTDEQAQDAVGGMLADTSTIDLTYTDVTPELKADVKTDSIDNTFLANMAQSTIKGRAAAAGTGDPADLTATQVKTLLAIAAGDVSGLGALATASSVGSATIDDDSVTNVELANMAQSTVKGREAAAGTGDPADLTATQVRTILDTNTTPSTQAFGDATAVGTADTLARGDHKHAMPALGTGATDACAGNDARLSDSRTPRGIYLGGGSDTNINDAASLHTLFSQALTIAAGDVLEFEALLIVLNNSGGTKTYTCAISLGGTDQSLAAGTTVAASATARAPFWVKGSIWVNAANDVRWWLEMYGVVPAAANTAFSFGNVNNFRGIWNATAADLTGAQTAAIKFQSSATGGTAQTATLLSARIAQMT